MTYIHYKSLVTNYYLLLRFINNSAIDLKRIKINKNKGPEHNFLTQLHQMSVGSSLTGSINS